jgi:hypothetical protein
MNRIAKWEWAFILVASIQILLALSIQNRPDSGSAPDPFPGEYLKANSLEQAMDDSRKPLKISLPESTLKDWMVGELKIGNEAPLPPSPTPALKASRPSEEPVRAFLLEPTHQTVFRKDRKEDGSFRVMFRFEVFPKDRAGKIQVLKNGKTELEIPFEGSADGSHRTGAMIQNPGVYQWRITTEDYKGDYRNFTLRP